MAVRLQQRPAAWLPTRLAIFLADARERGLLLTAAAELAEPGARVLVLHVGASAASRRLVESAAAWLARAGLAVQAEALPAGLPVAWSLMSRVRTLAPDLIVMGSRGLVGAPAVGAGSVSHEVLRHATCPVLLVPEGAESRSGQGPVVAGWDGSPASDRALKIAARLAAAAGASLQVVQVTSSGEPEGRAPRLAANGGWIVTAADPDGVAATLDRVASGMGARLLVIGTRRLSILEAIKLDSVGHQLLALSDRPVVIAP